ncbi:glycosyltransferase family 2 protein [Patescibacteria group bacterium]|nr:glycosyltransferase family 2 protein [Patescibacteria group bacterium]
MSKVAVVILNFKTAQETLTCLKSVQNSNYPEIAIYIVDNNSNDGLATQLQNQPGIFYIQSQENLGYTGGNNLGIKQAVKDGATAVLVLNPDTMVTPTCIREMASQLEDPVVGIVGPKILFQDRQTIWYAGGILDLKNVIGQHRGVNEKDNGQYEQIVETDFITGAAMLIRTAVLEKVGYFDDRFFLYYEDSDLSYRAKKAGFKLIYNPEAVVYHDNAKATGLGSPLQDYFITRNRLLFASKHLKFRTRFALFREVLKNIGMKTRRLALLDFCMGNFGKGSYPL